MALPSTDQHLVTEENSLHLGNRRIIEFLILAALIAIGGPVAMLFGVMAGEKKAAIAYPEIHQGPFHEVESVP